MAVNPEETLRGFPNPFLPEEDKAKKDYGKQFLKKMWSDHNSKQRNFFDEQDRISSLRNWAMGTPSIEDYKDRDKLESGDTSLLSKDWTPASAGVLKNLVNISSNKLIDRPYDIVATAVDKDSKDKLNKRLQDMFGKVKIKNAIKDLEAKGDDVEGLSDLKDKVKDAPDTIDDVQFDAELNWKTEEEESIESGIRYTFHNNKIDEIKKVISRDLHVVDSAGAWVRYDDNGDIEIEAIDRKNLIFSYYTKPDASDATYLGLVLEMSISELRKRASNELTESDLFDIAKRYAGNRGNQKWTLGSYYNQNSNTDFYNDFKVLVLFGQFKTQNIKVWREKESKKGNSSKFDKVPSNYSDTYETESGEKKKRGVKEVIRKSVIDIYEGYYVCDTDYCFGYKKQENIIRRKKNGVISTDAEFNIVVYTPSIQDGTSKGMTESMIPYIRQMLNIEYKIQHLIQEAKPKNVAIDVSALQGVTAGLGKGYVGTKGLAEIYDKTGRIYYRTHDQHGKPQTMTGQPPIKELENGLSSNLERLVGIYNHWVSQLYAVSGINPTIDGTANPKGALVGIEELRETAYNSATKHYVDAYTNIIERIGDRVALMIKYNINRGVNVYGYKLALGSLRVEVLKASKDLTNSELGISIKYKPTEKQKALFEESIKISLQQGQISVADANRAREVMESGSYKAANEYLARSAEKFMEKAHSRSIQLQQANGQVQIQSNQAAKASEAEIEKIKHQFKMEEIALEYDKKIQLAKIQSSEGRLDKVLQGEVDQDLIKTSQDINANTEVLNNTPSGGGSSPRLMHDKQGSIGKPRQGSPKVIPRPADDAQQRAAK